jgi:hypothetical protein
MACIRLQKQYENARQGSFMAQVPSPQAVITCTQLLLYNPTRSPNDTHVLARLVVTQVPVLPHRECHSLMVGAPACVGWQSRIYT